ncbi:MAG: FtsX-like permease family protein [Candidatus Aminicenantes bacterium]|nr:FtsX-like permease family protein [Candidatus Aminicenantes bacterium]
MSKKNHVTPPAFAERLLRIIYYDKGEFTHLGDFEEMFCHICENKSKAYARYWYCFQVLKSLPGFIKNKVYWSTAMLKNYLVIAVRNVVKNKVFPIINVTGLAVGMACFLLIMAYVQHETSYDRFHERSDRIFRLLSKESVQKGQKSVEEYDDHFPELMTPVFVSDFPEVKRASCFMDAFQDKAVLKAEKKLFYQSGLYADRNFLEIFTFPLIHGNSQSVLSEPNTIVITEQVSKKLFGNENPIGQIISYKERRRQYEVVVSGVVENTPHNSSIKFDYLLSLATLKADKANSFMFDNWNVANFQIFVMLTETGNKTEAEEKLTEFAQTRRNGTILVLQPIEDIHLRSQIRGELATNNEVRYVRLFSFIAVMVLLIACVNSMNLGVACSSKRAKEVGVRKVIGANRRQVRRQFLGESLFLSVLSLSVALLLMKLLLPRFSLILGVELELDLLNNAFIIGVMIGTALFVALASGSYPALMLSALSPVSSMKEHSISGNRSGRLRNILLVFQFTLSVILIICTVVVFRQMNFIKSKKLGFDREYVVVIPVKEKETLDKRQAIKTSFLQLPQVQGVSISSGLPINIRSRLINHEFVRGNGEKVRMDIKFDYVDEDFVDVFKINILQGRNFSRQFSEDKYGVLINETALKKIGWSDPVGKELSFTRDPYHVVGVVEDFQFATLHHQIEPMVLINSMGSNIAVRIHQGDVPAILGSLRRTFEKITRSQPFEFYFLDDAFDKLYQKEKRTGEIFGTFAGVTVLIACMGLFGLAVYMIDRRTKEIGIRKVLGASVSQLVTMLNKEFAGLILLSNLIAWPVAYIIMRLWLQDFAHRIHMSIWTFVFSGMGVLLISFVTVIFHAFKASSSNPVHTLRYE